MNSKTITVFVASLLLLIANVKAQSASQGAQDRPNLIIIQTDEHNFRTLGCYRDLMTDDQAFVWGPEAKVETPNIDEIANSGVICTSYYASSPVCTPSRASFVTGLYPQATGAPKNGKHLDKYVPTFAKILRDNGYATSYVGKWHLAGHDKYEFDVKDNGGFEDNRYMMKGGHAPYFHFVNDKIKGIGERQYNNLSSEERENTAYVTDFFTDKAMEILERDKDKPFCLMLSIPDPHTPNVARPPYDEMFKNMEVEAPKTMGQDLSKRPGWATQEGNDAGEFDAKGLRNYFGMVKCIDDNVGRILTFLEENNLRDNTIVVFTSDHGDMFFEHHRENKGIPYEASAKIPFVMSYPDKIQPGKVINTAYTTVDFAPTILGVMGIENNITFHGLNASEDFLNQENEITGDRITYYAKNGGWWVAAVNDRYKLVIDKKESPYLFDLEKDPDELINFYNDKTYTDVAQKLQTELFEQMEKYDEPGLKNRPYIME